MRRDIVRLLAALGVSVAIMGPALADDAAAVKAGDAVFQKWCAPCHGHGPDKPGTIALQALYKGAKPAALEDRTDLTPDFLKLYVRHGVSVMPPFRKTEVSDADLAVLTAYLMRTKR
ncbi:MAG TPA: cytochrome c [Steroidobacteraceae bacterium]|nr:cytochrome c [Steroidobacteraceae bacterium]